MERGKNRAIEFFRFFFCCGIFFFHFGALHAPETAFWPFAGGYLGVEFFFLVAGWLMMPRLLRLPRGRAGLRPALELFAGRVRRLYPPYLISLLALLAARKLLYPAYGLLPALRGGLPDLLLLQVFRGNWTMEILYWFVSALLWAGLLLSLLVLAFLVWLLFTRQGWLSRLLEKPLCEKLGALSYGMYLNQPLVLLLLRPLSGRLGLWPGALLELLALIALSRAENLLLGRLSRRERARDGSRT